MFSENDPDNENQSEDEERFVNAAYELEDKYNMMINKYQLLLMKDSMVRIRRFYIFFRSLSLFG